MSNLSRSVPLAAMAVLACLCANPSRAEPRTATFGRWSVTVDEISTGQDALKTCAASTAFVDPQGSAGTLTLSISNGDALPPNGYPTVMLAVDNNDLPKGDNIAATFSDVNDKVAAKFRESGGAGPHRQWMMDNNPKTSLALLRSMRRAPAIDVVLGKQSVASIAMDGFTKAYRSLGTSCGFPTADVAP
jgi:hypothetical protein